MTIAIDKDASFYGIDQAKSFLGVLSLRTSSRICSSTIMMSPKSLRSYRQTLSSTKQLYTQVKRIISTWHNVLCQQPACRDFLKQHRVFSRI